MDNQIKPTFQHSKLGMFCFNICAKWTKFLVKHRILYYILACTWGIIMTIIGIIITGIFALLKLFGMTVEFEHCAWVYDIKLGPDYWGGCQIGLMFMRDRKSGIDHINNHEFGHSFQNCLFGPFGIFLIFLPSAIRYWYQAIRTKNKKPNTPYDGIWFEDAASQCGKYAMEYITRNKK